MSQPSRRRIIVDTDPGIDDAMSLLYLHANPNAELHSLTTVFGNGSVELTTQNANYLVNRFGLAVPVIAGAAGPLAGERIVPGLKVHGQDGLGDTGLASGQSVRPSAQPAWQWIAEAARANPGELTILAIGPLTNLALVLQNEPETESLIREVIVMGGAMGTHGRNGNITPFAEANFYYDPDAADLVLSAEWPVTMVGLDVTSDCILSADRANAMPSEMGDAGQFMREISVGYEAIYREFDGIDGFVIHDVAAAICALSPDLFEFQSAAIKVTTQGDERGRTTIGSVTGRSAQRFCTKVNAPSLLTNFLTTMRAWSEPVEYEPFAMQQKGK